jgi:hypothetical protein
MYTYSFSPAVCKLPPRKPSTIEPEKLKQKSQRRSQRRSHRKSHKSTPNRNKRNKLPSPTPRMSQRNRRRHRRRAISQITEQIVTDTKLGTPITQIYNESWVCNDNGLCKLVRKEINDSTPASVAEGGDLSPLISPYSVSLYSFASGLDGFVYQVVKTRRGNRKWIRTTS